MAYKKDIKAWLKEVNLTMAEVDAIWEECIAVNTKCKLLHDAGKNWTDLHISVIRDLPTTKETTLRNKAEREEAERRQAEHDRSVEEYNKYFSTHFDEIMLKMIDDGEEIESRYLRELVSDSLEDFYGENLRWCRSVESIIELCGRYFSITWYQGLTECQENEFNNQPVEVFKNTEVMIEVRHSWDSQKSGVVPKNDLCGQVNDWLDKLDMAVNKIEFRSKVK